MRDEKILSVRNLYAGYDQKMEVRNVSFEVSENEVVCIIGDSGSGKSTLIGAIADIPEMSVTVRSGVIQRKGKMAMILQNPDAAFNPNRKIWPQMTEMLKSNGMYDRHSSYGEFVKLFQKIGIGEGERLLESYPFELSGGMKQRAAIAAAISIRAELLLADEPTSALDAGTEQQVISQLLRVKEIFHTAMIIVTHNMAIAGKIADKIGVMHEGEMIEFGTREEVLLQSKSEYTAGLIKAVEEGRKIYGKLHKDRE